MPAQTGSTFSFPSVLPEKEGDHLREYAWWQNTSTNLWRTFFKILQGDTSLNTPADNRKFQICDSVYNRLSDRDKDILRNFHTAKMGYLAYAVEDYSARTGIAVPVIYSVINKAGRSVMVELGIVNPYSKDKR